MGKKLKTLLPDMPDFSDETRIMLHRKYAERYMFYKKHKDHVDCFCTNCFSLDRVYRNDDADPADKQVADAIRHNTLMVCPHCGTTVRAKSEGVSRNGLTRYKYICWFEVTDSAVYAIFGELISGYGNSKMSVDEMKENYGGSKFDIYYVMEYKPGSARLIQWDFWQGDGYCVSDIIYEPYISYGGLYVSKSYFFIENPEVLENTFLKYILPTNFCKGWNTEIRYNGHFPFKFMAYAVNYPAVEMLLKNGGLEIIKDIIDREKPCKKVIDLEGKTPAEVFKTDPNDAALIRNALRDKPYLGLSFLQCWSRLKAGKRKGKYKISDAVNLVRTHRNYNDVINMANRVGLTVRKYINYTERQAEKRKVCPSVVEALYEDYIRECVELGYDIKDPQICKPTDFYTAHERTSAAVRAKIEEEARKMDAEKQEAYLKRYRKLCRKYEYSDEFYSIIVPANAVDIIEEGKKQQHCVAGYAERHLRGALTILFMRSTRIPGQPLYTIEMDGSRLVQIRGYENTDPSYEAMAWVKQWLEWVKLPHSKKHPKKHKNEAA